MSRVGLEPVSIPDGVEVTLGGQEIIVKKGNNSESVSQNRLVSVEREGNFLIVKPSQEGKSARQMWGTMRALLHNAVVGFDKGFEKRLEISGVGFRVLIKGRSLVFSLGFSHDVDVEVPEGIEVNDGGDKRGTSLVIKGASKQAVGQFASNIKRLRKTDVYKGKGIRYAGERRLLKEGKKK